MRTADRFKREWLFGLLAWAAQLWMLKQATAGIYWIVILLLFSAMFLMPLARCFWQSDSPPKKWHELELAWAIGMATTFFTNSAVEAIPWLMFRFAAAVEAARYCSSKTFRDPAAMTLLAARIFPAVGAVWFVAHRANWTPWGFDPLIVLLTAAHFHHAGFTLPLMAGLNARTTPGCLTRFSCVAILSGVPLVAVGIMCTHFGVLKFVEPFGVAILVLGALGVAVSQMRQGLQKQRPFLVRLGFVLSGASLLAAMLLALGFGMRYVIPNFALSMPQMWMIHGTLNAFGFGWCGILAWRWEVKQRSAASADQRA